MSYFNAAAEDQQPRLLNDSERFEELLALTESFGLDATNPPSCLSRNLVVRGLRFNLLEWSPAGEVSAATERPVLFLVHGGAVSAHTWDIVALQLARHYRVIAPDIRGHGDSEWPRDGDSDHHEMMEDLAALVGELELPPVVAVGHSLGGALVERLALGYPQLVRAIAIVDFTPEPNYPGLPAGKIRLFDSIEHYAERAARYGNRQPAELLYAAKHELLQRLDGKLMPKHDPRHVMGGPDPEYYPGTPSFEQMSAVQVPALVLWGSESFFVTDEKCQRLADAMPRGEAAVITGAGHQLFLERPAQFIDLLEQFVRSV
ncbi:MAG TPA: hypothetical protein DCF45_07005 [Gammaproteobacteria bacterium]|nr:hypothetical protein [Gammaproteobacteria bacterium]